MIAPRCTLHPPQPRIIPRPPGRFFSRGEAAALSLRFCGFRKSDVSCASAQSADSAGYRVAVPRPAGYALRASQRRNGQGFGSNLRVRKPEDADDERRGSQKGETRPDCAHDPDLDRGRGLDRDRGRVVAPGAGPGSNPPQGQGHHPVQAIPLGRAPAAGGHASLERDGRGGRPARHPAERPGPDAQPDPDPGAGADSGRNHPAGAPAPSGSSRFRGRGLRGPHLHWQEGRTEPGSIQGRTGGRRKPGSGDRPGAQTRQPATRLAPSGRQAPAGPLRSRSCKPRSHASSVHPAGGRTRAGPARPAAGTLRVRSDGDRRRGSGRAQGKTDREPAGMDPGRGRRAGHDRPGQLHETAPRHVPQCTRRRAHTRLRTGPRWSLARLVGRDQPGMASRPSRAGASGDRARPARPGRERPVGNRNWFAPRSSCGGCAIAQPQSHDRTPAGGRYRPLPVSTEGQLDHGSSAGIH